MAPIRRPDFGFRNSLHSNEELLANTIAPNWVSLSLSLALKRAEYPTALAESSN